ncbi:39769_t:CDS:2, partial [Gigaspora margarita]
MGVKLIYGETGRPKAFQDKQLENHRKLAGLSKDSIEKTRSEPKASLKKSTLSEYLSIFTINVATATLHNILTRLDESSGGQSSDETTSTIDKPRRKKKK